MTEFMMGIIHGMPMDTEEDIQVWTNVYNEALKGLDDEPSYHGLQNEWRSTFEWTVSAARTNLDAKKKTG